MGMYICQSCFDTHGLQVASIQTPHFGCCELCGRLRGDWSAPKWLNFTSDVSRSPIIGGGSIKRQLRRLHRAIVAAGPPPEYEI